jgi:hypothetical protein
MRVRSSGTSVVGNPSSSSNVPRGMGGGSPLRFSPDGKWIAGGAPHIPPDSHKLDEWDAADLIVWEAATGKGRILRDEDALRYRTVERGMNRDLHLLLMAKDEPVFGYSSKPIVGPTPLAISFADATDGRQLFAEYYVLSQNRQGHHERRSFTTYWDTRHGRAIATSHMWVGEWLNAGQRLPAVLGAAVLGSRSVACRMRTAPLPAAWRGSGTASST